MHSKSEVVRKNGFFCHPREGVTPSPLERRRLPRASIGKIVRAGGNLYSPGSIATSKDEVSL